MSGTRVLRLYHSGVVEEYRQRDRLLRSRHGYDVHLVVPPEWDEGGVSVAATSDPGVPVHVVRVRGRRHPILFWYSMRELRRVVREVQPQVVDIHEEPYSLAAAAALRVVGREAPDAAVCIYSAQNILKRYPWPFRAFESRALQAAAAAYPCSTEAGDVLRRKGFRGLLHVLPLGVSMRAAREVPRSNGPLAVGFVGRLEPYKGGELALRAFAAASEGIDARLEFVGDGSDRQRLGALAELLGVSDRVRFLGAVSQGDALRQIAGLNVLLVPSLTTRTWKEQYGRVPAQALAAGVPVIASDSGSLPEVLGDFGELVPEGDHQALAGRLAALLRDPDRRAAMAARGRRYAADRLSWEAVADGCHRMYQEGLAGRTRAR